MERFPDPETLAVCERFSLWLRQGGGLPIRGRPLPGGLAAGLDFEGHREYRPGQDLRHLDWALYARLRSLYVRTFEDEGAGTLAVLVDASASMGLGEPAKFSLARRLAAALVFAGLRECHGVLLGVARGGRLDALPLTGGLSALSAALDWLAGARPEGETHLAASFEAVPRIFARGDAVILSDLFDPRGLEPTLDVLLRAGWRADVVRITHADEWRAPPPGRGLSDPESPAVAVSPREREREALEARLTAWRAHATAQARRRGCTLVDVDAAEPLPRALTRFFSAVLSQSPHV